MTLKAALGLAVSSDDDGHAAGDGELISLQQVEELVAICDAVSADKEALCRYFRVKSLADISVKDFPRVVSALEKKRKQNDRSVETDRRL
jgi:hypothetical protein